MNEIIGFFMTVLDPLRTIVNMLWDRAPVMIGAFLILLLGFFVGHWLRLGLEHVLKVVNLDEYARRAGVSRLLTRLGLGGSPAGLLGDVLYAVVLLSCLIAAADAVQLTIVREYLRRMVDFVPHFLSVVFVMAAGLYLGNLCGRVVRRAADANHVKGSDTLSKIAYGLVVVVSGLMALEILGITMETFPNAMMIVGASVGLGVAIAFGVAVGMAGRETAEKSIRDLMPHNGSSERVLKVR